MSFLNLLPVALLAGHVAAQTFTSCNPLNSTCPSDPALGTVYSTSFNSSQSELDPNFWNVTAGEDLITFSDNGAELSIVKSGDSVTAQSSFYIFWGSVEIMMQAAAGQGIISTLVLLSDDLDEIDLEIMGGNTSFIESNYYGWGNQSQFNAEYYPCDGPQESIHNYTVTWDQQNVQWLVDGAVARTVPYAAPGQYPQTPSFIRFGIWAGGDPSEPAGTIAWAGGPTDYSKGPFTMTVQSIKITDGSTNTSSYLYENQSGSFSSIKATAGESAAFELINKESATENAVHHWNGLSTGAKIGIACGVLGVFAVAVIAFAVFCISQRRRGKTERMAADQAWDEQNAELMAYRQQMAKGNFAVTHMGHGEKF